MPAVLVLHPRVAVAGEDRRAGAGAGDGEAPVHARAGSSGSPGCGSGRGGTRRSGRRAPRGSGRGCRSSACSAGPRPRSGTGPARGRRAGSASTRRRPTRRRPPRRAAASTARRGRRSGRRRPCRRSCVIISGHCGPRARMSGSIRSEGVVAGAARSASFGQPRDRAVAGLADSRGRRAGARRRTRRAGRACRALRRNWTSGDGRAGDQQDADLLADDPHRGGRRRCRPASAPARRPRPGRGTRTGRRPWGRSGTSSA